jgi:hypothetical protein
MSDVEGDEGLGGFTNIVVNDCPAEVQCNCNKSVTTV